MLQLLIAQTNDNVQIYISLDCCNVDQNTPPSKPVLAAAKTAREEEERKREELCYKHKGWNIQQGVNGFYTGHKNCTFDKVMTRILDTTPAPNFRTQNQSETLSTSMLPHLKTKGSSYEEIKEAFCRDVDVFNIAYEVN